MTIGADGTHHVEIQRDFLCPPAIGAWVVGTCVLVNLPEAAIGGCARWEAKLGTVDRQVCFGIGVIKGIDNRNRLVVPASCCKIIRRAQIDRPEAGGTIRTSSPIRWNNPNGHTTHRLYGCLRTGWY